MFELSSSLEFRYENSHPCTLTIQLSPGMSRLPGEAGDRNIGVPAVGKGIGEVLPLYSTAKQTHFVLFIF